METPKRLRTVKELLARKRYAEASEGLRGIDPLQLGRSEYGVFCILKAETALYLGDYSVENLIDKAIEIYRPTADSGGFARAKFLKGWCLSSLGRHLEAKEALLEAYVSHLRCDDLGGAARDLNQLSYVTFQVGDIGTAIQNLEKCLDIYRELNDGVSYWVASMNLATLYLRAGRLGESLGRYADIAVGLTEQGERDYIIFHVMSGLLHALRGEIETAKRTLEPCLPLIDKYAREKAIYYENLGHISILAGDFEVAEKALTAGLDISLDIAPESALVSQIKRLLADLCVATGRIDPAKNFATAALVVAEKINERAEIAACYRVFARVEQHGRNETSARRWYRKAIGLFAMIDCRYELAVTHSLAARSGLFLDGERTAMLYLAREYFDSEGVTHQVSEIDAQLRQIQMPRSQASEQPMPCPVVVAVSPRMRGLVSLARRVARSDMKVFLMGAAGTGKDLMARYIHHWSGRSGEFVTVSSATRAEEPVDAILLGRQFRRGGQSTPGSAGLLRQVSGGTLYLSELTDMSHEFQAKLLAVLAAEERRHFSSGGRRRFDFRLVAATSLDPQRQLREGRLHLDLYNCLREVPIKLPPLDERQEDIPALVRHFLAFGGFSLAETDERTINELGRALARRDWPGNVRQLKTEVQHLWVASKGDVSAMVALAQEAPVSV